jgi:hypothetical protein
VSTAQLPSPFFREAGSGPGIGCLQSNASSSGKWRALMETLAPASHVLAADSYGAGKSPEWPIDRPVRLQDEVAPLEPVFARAACCRAKKNEPRNHKSEVFAVVLGNLVGHIFRNPNTSSNRS